MRAHQISTRGGWGEGERLPAGSDGNSRRRRGRRVALGRNGELPDEVRLGR
jgi:hypothetical protein